VDSERETVVVAAVRLTCVQRPTMMKAHLTLLKLERNLDDLALPVPELVAPPNEVCVSEESRVFDASPTMAAVEHDERAPLFVDVMKRDPSRDQVVGAARCP